MSQVRNVESHCSKFQMFAGGSHNRCLNHPTFILCLVQLDLSHLWVVMIHPSCWASLMTLWNSWHCWEPEISFCSETSSSSAQIFELLNSSLRYNHSSVSGFDQGSGRVILQGKPYMMTHKDYNDWWENLRGLPGIETLWFAAGVRPCTMCDRPRHSPIKLQAP